MCVGVFFIRPSQLDLLRGFVFKRSRHIPVHILHMSKSLSFNGVREGGGIGLVTGRGSSIGSCFFDWDFWFLGLFMLFLRVVLSWGHFHSS